jgi:hypothetical protein
MGFNSGFKGLKCTRLKKSNFLLISEKGTKKSGKEIKGKREKKGRKVTSSNYQYFYYARND